MIRAVIDTNLFLSGLLNASGAPAKLILRWLKGQFEILISEQTMEEYTHVLRHSPGVEQNSDRQNIQIPQRSRKAISDVTIQVQREIVIP